MGTIEDGRAGCGLSIRALDQSMLSPIITKTIADTAFLVDDNLHKSKRLHLVFNLSSIN